MKMTKIEKETVIIFNEAEKDASITTYNTYLKKRLSDLADTFPSECHLVSKNADGSMTYSMNKKLLSIRKPWNEDSRNKARRRMMEDKDNPLFRKD